VSENVIYKPYFRRDVLDDRLQTDLATGFVERTRETPSSASPSISSAADVGFDLPPEKCGMSHETEFAQ
jgi:hypothetical protein